jgi:hypothetical protein
MIGAYLDDDLAQSFDAWARARGGKSAALRALIRDAVGAAIPESANAPSLNDLHVRLTENEREAVRQAAHQKGMPPSTWVRSLIRAHVTRRPQWGSFERQKFAAVLTALSRIGSNVNQIARAMNVAALKGEYSPHQGREAREAAAEVSRAIAQLGDIVGQDLNYWGLSPMKERSAKSPHKPVLARGSQPAGP